MATVGDLLAQSPRLSTPPGQVSDRTWRAAVGRGLSSRSKPIKLHHGELLVEVPSATWAQELSFLSAEVISRLQSAKVEVRRLRFITRKAQAASTQRTELVRRLPASSLPESLRRRLDSLTDSELRSRIESAATLSLANSGLAQRSSGNRRSE